MGRGDEEFVQFAEASFGGLLHTAYLLTGDRHAAEDAAQAALARTYAAWSSCPGHSRPGTASGQSIPFRSPDAADLSAP